VLPAFFPCCFLKFFSLDCSRLSPRAMVARERTTRRRSIEGGEREARLHDRAGGRAARARPRGRARTGGVRTRRGRGPRATRRARGALARGRGGGTEDRVGAAHPPALGRGAARSADATRVCSFSKFAFAQSAHVEPDVQQYGAPVRTFTLYEKTPGHWVWCRHAVCIASKQSSKMVRI